MTNIYNKTVFERNDIQTLPAGFIDTAANDLFRFMGSFWKNLHGGTGLVKGIQNVRGIKLAQFYLDLLETLKLQDRKGLPVYHRELWKPLIIRKSERNTAQENILKLGGDTVLGEQPSGSKYGEGTVLEIGRLSNLDKYVTYPVDGDITDIVTGITNNVINPTVSYKICSEFPSSDIVYTNGTLIFPIEKDPFRDDSEFDVYDLPSFYANPDDPETQIADRETVLWASDVLIDKDYVSDHMSYALGISCSSTDVAKAIINAGWDALNCGLTPELLRTLLAAMLNIPVIQEENETITRVTTDSDGTKTVVTDSHTYTVYSKAVLRSAVRKGAILSRGDFLDESVKVYPILTDVSAEKLSGTTEYADILKTDVPIISVPKTLLRTATSNGLYVDWTPTDVIDSGEVDSNGHRKLYFELGGSEADVTAFWEDIWEKAEQDNVNLEELLAAASSYGSSSDSDTSWKIIPAEFFLEYLIGSNTLIITFDRNQVEDSSLLRDPMFFNLLNRVLPLGMRLFFVEHLSLDGDDDTCDVGGAEDDAETYVLEDIAYDEMDYNELPGMKGKRMPTYEDEIEMKLYRNRKRRAE